MSNFSVSVFAVVVSLGLAGVANATDAKDALNAGAQIVAVTALSDDRIVITFQKEKAAVVCLMKKAIGDVINTESCFTVR